MELKLKGGQYQAADGGLETVNGAEETLQRCLMRLTARRGGFWPDAEYGSRLHTLCRMKPGERPAAARAFVAEALSPETTVTVEDVEYVPGDDGGAFVTVTLRSGGRQARITVEG